MSSVRTAKRSRWPAGPESVVMTTRYPLDHPGGVESVARALVDCFGRSDGGWRATSRNSVFRPHRGGTDPAVR